MPLIVKNTRSKFTAAPEGLWQAVCCDVIDLGPVDTQYGPKPMVQLRWQLDPTAPPDGPGVDPETGKRYMVINRYNLSLNEKATLRLQLESWRGRKFSEEELQGFDLEVLIGVNCQIQVIHNIGSNDQVYANVQALVPMNKKSTKMRVEDYVRKKDQASSNGSPADAAKEEAAF